MSDKQATAIYVFIILAGIGAIAFYAFAPHSLFWAKILVAITYPIISFFLRRKARKQ